MRVNNVEPLYNNNLFLNYPACVRSCEFIIGRLRHYFISLCALSV